MNQQKVIQHIVSWLDDYVTKANMNGFVVGVSGGIDSALTSTLCAMTGKSVVLLNMPIRQHAAQYERSVEHINWLKKKFENVSSHTVELNGVLDAYESALPDDIQDFLTMANTRSRMRMITLYAFAGHHKLVVAGTGNKIEDFGVGFFTKYGDGGVDISPIADLTKTEVYALAKELGVAQSIQVAPPTDGLFGDDRSDEDQIGASYPELEWAMDYLERNSKEAMTDRQKIVMEIYLQRNRANKHKMIAIPVCTIPKELKEK